MNFNKSKIAAAVGAAALALSTQAGAVVVVGGDNGWEVSFDGNINLFYNNINYDNVTVSGAAVAATAGGAPGAVGAAISGENSSHLNEGLLPAFFSFNAKSPTVNGLTGTARISFAPDSSSSKASRNDKGGSAIDMREVVASVEGSFGTISFGRTLGIFGRQALLKDQTLFGVGGVVGSDGGGTTLGRIGYGYIYPEFRTRFSYKTPNMNGFQAEIGMFDPQENTATGANIYQTDTPQFQGELTYASTFNGGAFNLWAEFLWQEQEQQIVNDTITTAGVDAGGEITFSGFQLVGHYYTGQALGVDFQSAGAAGAGASGIFGSPGYNCGTASCSEADNDGFYVQGGYTFNGKTKVAASYGETNQSSDVGTAANGGTFNDISHEMWTIGVYHDVNSWLKLVAEYNNYEQRAKTPAGAAVNGFDADVFSVGAFMFW